MSDSTIDIPGKVRGVRINPNRVIERMVGGNRLMIMQLVGSYHVGQSKREVAREILTGTNRKAFLKGTTAWKRGVIWQIMKQHEKNIQEYNDVMRGVPCRY